MPARKNTRFTRRQIVQSSGVLTLGSLLPSHASRAMSGTPKSLSFEEYRQYDAMSLAELVRKREVSAAELLALAIERAERVNRDINAINLPHYELARSAIKAGLPEGPLTGVPWLLKDLHLQWKGTRTSYGSRFFADHVANLNSTLVERYQRAGLVIFGKTHSPELGGTATTESALWGETRNPWNLAYSSGGSSGGASAAIAAGILPAANASDGGGSIRIPASCCGLFGMKPTRARTPLGPDRFEGNNGASCVHAITRSVRDSALLLDISQGPEPGMPYHAPALERPYLQELQQAPGKLRIAVMREPIIPVPVHKACQTAIDEAARLCASLGHEVEDAAPEIDAKAFFDAINAISSVGTLAIVTAREQQLGRAATEADLEPLIYERAQKGKKVSGLQYAQARAFYQQLGGRMAQFHEKYDVLLCPTMAAPPPKIGSMSLSGDYEAFIDTAVKASVFTQLFNVTGQPAMSVPLHWSDDGLPIGVMFAAQFGDEARLFRLAAQLEQAQPWFDKVPASLS